MGYDLSSGESMKIQFKNDLDVPNILEFPDECMKSNVIKDFESQVKLRAGNISVLHAHVPKKTRERTCIIPPFLDPNTPSSPLFITMVRKPVPVTTLARLK